MECHALWLTGPEQIELRREPLPPLGPTEVHVQALLSAISHGTEMLVYHGRVSADLPLDLPTFAGSFAYPIKYGYASVGRVEAVGSEVETLHPGDLVFCLYPHQDRYVVPADLVVRLPDGVPPEAGVFYANLETAVNIMLDAAPRFGETVVVFGQGVVGLLVTLLLKHSSARQVITVDPLAGRRDLSREIGADVALAPNGELAARVRELTGGRGTDIVIEVSGAPAALQQALACAATQGTIVVASWYGTKPVALDLGSDFHRRRLRLVSSQVGMLDPSLAPRWSMARRRELVISLLAELPVRRLITQRVPFTRAAGAYRLVARAGEPVGQADNASNPEPVIQVVLDYQDG